MPPAASEAPAAQPVDPTQPGRSAAAPPLPWLLQPGLLGVSNGLWLDLGALLLGGVATGLGIWNRSRMSRLRHDLRRNKGDIQNAFAHIQSINQAKSALQTQLSALQRSCQQLERQQTGLTSTLDQQLSQAVRADQRLQDAQITRNPQPLMPPPPPQPTPGQLQAELTEVINRGDRQAIRSRVQAQLNITSASESALSTGRLTETQLEEVSAGGSYWLAMIAGEAWLYPTDLTLKGFAQHQPSKGIFHYSKQAVSAPRVLAPARLASNGACWQIAELGRIAVPG